MTAKRILKEAHPLFWPWCAVALAGVLPLVYPLRLVGGTIPLGFIFGIPLLATLSFGNEFQHRTLPLVLSQPVNRMEIWGEKLSIMLGTVLSVVLLFIWATWPASFRADDLWALAGPGAWLVAALASATFWTLVTRSTLGGLALNIAAQGSVILAAQMADRFFRPAHATITAITDGVRQIPFFFLLANIRLGAFPVIALLGYAGVMLWLGRRELARFQVTGSMAGGDLLTAGPDVMPGALAGWFRSRPTGVVLNLFRKEFRLLRPLWLFTLVATVGWACITALELLRARRPVTDLPLAAKIVGMSCVAIAAILAGSLSLGEEKTSGRQAWHMTLPVSTLRQWLIKLFMAFFAGFVCAGVLPALLMIAGRYLFGLTFMVDVRHFQISWLLGTLLLTAAAFWCACAADGTVSAVLWVIPMLAAVWLAPMIGAWAGTRYELLLNLKFNLFANFRFDVWVSHSQQFQPRTTPLALVNWIPTAFLAGSMFSTHTPGTLIVLISTVILGGIQSFRLFRGQVQGSALLVVRKLVPLVMLAFLCSFALSGLALFATQAAYHAYVPINYTNRAIENVLGSTANLNAGHPLQFTADDLEHAHPLPEDVSRWLQNARITVIPISPTGGVYHSGTWRSSMTPWYYLAVIHLANGTDLTMLYQRGDSAPFGRFSVRIRWPGAAEEEPMWGQ